MNPQSDIENQQSIKQGNDASNEASEPAAAQPAQPQPFAFLQPFGGDSVGVCDVEGNCS